MRTVSLNYLDQRIVQNTRAFALDRLADRSFLEWALMLRSDQVAERAVLRDLVDYRVKEIAEPYLQAWQYLFEFWDGPSGDSSQDRLLLKQELKSGGSQTEIICLIVAAVRPWIQVESAKKLQAFGHKLPKKPKRVRDIFWVSMEGGKGVTPDEIGLGASEDRDFLFELAVALNAALLSGLNQARRIGYIGHADPMSWLVQRVYYVPPEQFADGGGEPDRHKQGFAPTTKLLFAVVKRLALFDKKAASRVVSSWDTDRSKLYKRLWAAVARDESMIGATDVAEFLTKLDDQEFWWPHAFPEIAELRAVRWNSLPEEVTKQLEQRIIKGEPPARLKKRLGKEEAKSAVVRLSIMEFQRIKLAGGHLSAKAGKWLQNAVSAQPKQAWLASVTEDFGAGVRSIKEDRSGDPTFADVPSSRLIEELARHLGDDGWDNKSRVASEYIGRNPDVILDLLAGKPYSPARAKVWQAFGYSFRPTDINAGRDTATTEDQALVPTALRACGVIAGTDVKTLEEAISGLTTWISTWDRLLNGEDDYIRAWLALWPVAVIETNRAPASDSRLRERSYSTPVGQLVHGLIRAIPAFRPGTLAEPPWSEALLSLQEATGEAKLQAQYQTMLFFEYFWSVDQAWTRKNLLAPLLEGENDLWHAFADTRYIPTREVLEQLGPMLVEVAAGNEMAGEVRGALARRAVFATILDKRDGRDPAIPIRLTQQLLRLGGDEVRMNALRAMKNYLENPGVEPLPTPSQRFALIKEMFEDVWPKELTLSSPKLSDALADFPAKAASHFSEAANLILPYLTPFDSWSLYEYGVLDRSDKTITGVDSAEDAAAFLAILDKTVGTEEGAIVPNGLDRALRHIGEKSPRLEKDTRFQRLLTLSRR
ncbi:hypothetical protein [Sinorhizobium meliloti]|uniref:hypothetical protein n=1 Tax=Rhizobium meliloti TaxID=382 RepID=UPI000B4976BE|nr:hypothetical protein [Sinorhizobium meliloti]ASQ13133.1 hypothetical protein CDO22_24625 [Sinorhizobium meliloti]MQU84805.1 hypothetical protein [Sinorhizobium meliloti]MQU86389.1 hypothetical protein [Sinorhizobium meliloti]